MNEKEFKKLLGEIATEAFPDTPQPWPALRARLQASDRRQLHRGSNMKSQTIPSNPFRVVARTAALIVLAVLFAGAVLLLTPQGRAWAQSALQFFTRSTSDTLPLQSWQRTPLPENPTPDPAWNFSDNQAIREVEEQAGFDVLEPSWLPDVLTFEGATLEPEHSIVRIFYRYVDTNGLVLREQPFQRTEDCELCGMVGESAPVEAVMIGAVAGEYVEGVWNLTDDGPVWQSDPYMKTLRWQDNGIAFELLYMGPPDSLTKNDLIAIAESIQ